jgi:hypothetical protein
MTIDPAAFFSRPKMPTDIPLWEQDTDFAKLSEEEREELIVALDEAKGESGWDQMDEARSLLFEASEWVRHYEGLLAEARDKKAEAENKFIEASTPVLGFTTERVMESSGNRDRWIDALRDILLD